MFIPRKLFEEEEIPKQPTPLIIKNKEAINAQNELNHLLNREDIISNALPSNEEKPLIIFVHGYGSSKWLWIEPFFGTMGWLRNYHDDPKPRNYGWYSKPPPSHMYVPFSLSISPLIFPKGLFNSLIQKGYDAITYTQIDPFGDIDTSAKEIEVMLKGIKKIYGEKRLILVGHSRGGICIRRYLDVVKDTSVEKIITLGTPHKGTKFLNLALLKQPMMKILNQENIKKFWDVAGEREVRDINHNQITYNSKFLQQLKDREKNPEIKYISVAGRCSIFAHIYSWSLVKKTKPRSKLMLKIFSQEKRINEKIRETRKEDKAYKWIAHPKKVFTFFERRVQSEFSIGDGLVSLQSAIFPDSDRKYLLDVNHEELVTCEQTEKLLLKEIKLTQKEN
ncbi:MAG: alpha/beta hydrolase [Asgard group archaeon]|nr:alpha/beta hydrolase [Asgard group archaeon]